MGRTVTAEAAQRDTPLRVTLRGLLSWGLRQAGISAPGPRRAELLREHLVCPLVEEHESDLLDAGLRVPHRLHGDASGILHRPPVRTGGDRWECDRPRA